MPSGSHYSGGSHFGASSGHYSSSHSRSSTSGSSIRVNTGPRIIMFHGRQVYFSSTRNSLVSALIVLLLIGGVIAVMCGGMWLSSASDLRTIEKDYAHYQQMVAYAEAHPEYQGVATVKDWFRYEDGERYYIEYEIVIPGTEDPITHQPQTIKGNTFYDYELSYIRENYTKNGTIAIAMDTKNTEICEETDSIPMDYKIFKLTDNEEYNDSMSTIKISRIIFFVALVLEAVMAAGLITAYTTAKQATDEQLATLGKKITSTDNNNSDTWKCAYCGGVNANSHPSCDACGAKRK